MKIATPPRAGFPGLSLRQLERADLDAWYAYLSNPDVFRHTSWNLRSPDDLLPLFDNIESTDPDSIRRLAIVDTASGALAGTVGLHTVSTVNRSAEIAYDLAPSHWGRGIASAVCEAVTAWALTHGGFMRMQAVVLTSNAGSARVLQKCGYRYEGLLRAYKMVRGTPGDFAMYARLATD
ncbi:GNAT family N-acetyltransferase [Burkholderia cenocepacia]|uniref:GNAT family N-acetyltransferase n=1 Tax=Burkholderia cenocepacia TaxID=95486 RepID=UPI00078B1AEE|nr:GNAT family protein [Burkholderia cenocepacia]AMU08468.1 GCN5 family acetyltransferase [Burkholderia cenocepacia]MBN3506690.1 GNAT family N-acetyltransferase [Burkholderia cenocepacia]MBR8270238.1 GNAT family N-acetyltransferase [Burkholderia cenocepacia]MBR8408160.1 GNAT family N-acetyltransferase [Burkholderia cenocepacia]MBR8433397.1 GNAT family N-acetyltransferase [Burkholderia cenocepacia]